MPDTLTTLHRRINRLDRRVAALDRRYKADGWMLPIVLDVHRFGGGRMVWAFDGHSVHAHGHNSIWTENNIDASNYRAATYGGPNVTLDGSAEYLSIADAAWQETGTEEYLIWAWAYVSGTPAGGEAIASKWDANAGNLRSWRIYITGAPAPFYLAFQSNDTGIGGAGAVVTSSLALAADTWHFVGAYFNPSTAQIIYVGAQTDSVLTKTTQAVGVPASLFNGAASLKIGAITGAGGISGYWDGRIGKALGRANVPGTDIDGHVGMLFAMTRDAYEE